MSEFIQSILHSYVSQYLNIYKNVFSFWKSKWEVGNIGCLWVAGVTSLDCGRCSFSFLFFKSLITIRTKRRKANQNLQQNQVTVSQIPINWFPFKRNSLRLPQRKVVLMVTMSTVPSMILNLWTHSVKVWRHFQ